MLHFSFLDLPSVSQRILSSSHILPQRCCSSYEVSCILVVLLVPQTTPSGRVICRNPAERPGLRMTQTPSEKQWPRCCRQWLVAEHHAVSSLPKPCSRSVYVRCKAVQCPPELASRVVQGLSAGSQSRDTTKEGLGTVYNPLRDRMRQKTNLSQIHVDLHRRPGT